MARILIADNGRIPYSGASTEERPIGGAERAVIHLAEALAARGHEVAVRNLCKGPVTHGDVDWAPLDHGTPFQPDLFIASRATELLRFCPKAKRLAFWLHMPARYLRKFRDGRRVGWARPQVVFSGAYQMMTFPVWLPVPGKLVIPYGIDPAFCDSPPRQAPPPSAIYTSNPVRGLEALAALVADRLVPQVPGLTLKAYSGASTYAAGDEAGGEKSAVIARLQAARPAGLELHEPLPRAGLIEALKAARVMLYPGHVDETFCLAVAEAQALGVPAVVRRIGSLPERVIDGETGFVVESEAAFVARARELLTDDGLWARMHRQALARQRSWTWDKAAEAFEALLP